jgi:hypothetical protein
VVCSGYLLADEHINKREVLSRIIGIDRDRDSGLGGEVLDGDAGGGIVRTVVGDSAAATNSCSSATGRVVSSYGVVVPETQKL